MPVGPWVCRGSFPVRRGFRRHLGRNCAAEKEESTPIPAGDWVPPDAFCSGTKNCCTTTAHFCLRERLGVPLWDRHRAWSMLPWCLEFHLSGEANAAPDLQPTARPSPDGTGCSTHSVADRFGIVEFSPHWLHLHPGSPCQPEGAHGHCAIRTIRSPCRK